MSETQVAHEMNQVQIPVQLLDYKSELEAMALTVISQEAPEGIALFEAIDTLMNLDNKNNLNLAINNMVAKLHTAKVFLRSNVLTRCVEIIIELQKISSPNNPKTVITIKLLLIDLRELLIPLFGKGIEQGK